ncbi:MAG: hypothetical protein ABL940_00045 [Bacteroidia bacterium]
MNTSALNKHQPVGWLLAGAIILTGCAIPKTTQQYAIANKYYTSGGAEDIVIDTITNASAPRLIASCADYANKGTTNAIQAIELTTKRVHSFIRINEPANMPFKPHGIDLGRFNDSLFLYVINHENETLTSILTYYVKDTTLLLTKRFVSPLLISPNDISVNNKRELYISNDRSRKYNTLGVLLKLKKGTVVKIANDVCSVFSTGYCYANGMLACDSGVYVSTVRLNKLFFIKYNSGIYKKQVVAKFKGQDNITFSNNKLYVTSHPKQIKFIRHAKNQAITSPAVVYEIDLTTKHKRVVYSNSGKQISAVTTALMFKNKMYLSQLFVPFVLEVSN